MKLAAAITTALLLTGCMSVNEVTELNRCRQSFSCATGVPGTGYGPPHQAATGSTTGQQAPR